MAKTFNYDKVIFMNSGAEAVETAMKFARRWGYVKKGIPDDKARILWASNNFHGRTIAICGASDDPERYHQFGPFGGLEQYIVDYNDIDSLEEELKHPHCACFIVEPIQGEAGILLPNEGYLAKVRELCDKYNVLFISDEI